MAKSNFDPIRYVVDDGLCTPEIGNWGLKKYRLLGTYCDIFTTGMRKKWERLVYIDLFSGSGHAKIKNTSNIVETSSLISMSIPNKFTDYILCEQNPDKLSALQQRVSKKYPNIKPTYILGDTNENVKNILAKMPKFSRSQKVLTFCFVDPFSLNLNFSTITELSKHARIDFLILLALQMDARRNLAKYLNENNSKIAHFVGQNNWREEFLNGSSSGSVFSDFTKYLANKYNSNMQRLGYKPPTKMQSVNTQNNLGLYYLAFYSKHDRGNEFWKKIERYKNFQLQMEFPT